MQITTKIIEDNNGNAEMRYFCQTENGFDGTAQGYGFKSIEKLQKAYWFYNNRDKINAQKGKAKKFLKDNPHIKKMLDDYFSEDNYLYAAKDGEDIDMKTFLAMLKEEGNNREVIDKLNENKDIWRNLLD